MEDLKLIMDDVYQNREAIKKLEVVSVETIKHHNNLCDSYIKLAKKHNKLTKSFNALCCVCIVMDLCVLWNAIDISKIQKRMRKEEKEG